MSVDIETIKIAIISSRFNQDISLRLQTRTIEHLCSQGVAIENIKKIWVPGAFELPLAAAKCASSHTFAAIICLGCVIKGDTPHFDWICQATSRGIMDVSLKYLTPVVFGVLTTLSYEQALQRCSGTNVVRQEKSLKKPASDKSFEFAQSALDMINIMKDQNLGQ
jgi:6,7-dimethyl-8-ribityllumazine synthase